jgi:hypothetical protein
MRGFGWHPHCDGSGEHPNRQRIRPRSSITRALWRVEARPGSRFSGREDGVPDEANSTVTSAITPGKVTAGEPDGGDVRAEVSCPVL